LCSRDWRKWKRERRVILHREMGLEGMILLLVCLSDERPGRTDQLWGYSTSVEVLVRLE
jgi:hypothetical protein